MVDIILISDKILMGKQINKVSAYFAETLFKHNFRIGEHRIVSNIDNIEDLLEKKKAGDIFIFLVEKSNSQLNEKLGKICNSEIIDNPFIKNCIYEFYRKKNCPLEKESENEWKIPKNARAILNPNNITQGYILENKDVIYCVLPLNEQDARQMFGDVVLEYLLSNQKKKYKNFTLKTFGLSAENLKNLLNQYIKNKEKVTINLFEKNNGVDIVIKAQEENNSLDEIAQKIFVKLDKYIYSVEDVPISQVAYNLIKLNNLKISFAETITGGKLSAYFLAQEDKAIDYIVESIVAPNKKSKKDLLNVDETLIEQEGENSVKVVYQMATNLLKQSQSDIVVACVGNSVAQENLPAGLCYIAVGDKREVHIYKNVFMGSHNEIIESILNACYFYLIKKLKKNDFHFEQSTV